MTPPRILHVGQRKTGTTWMQEIAARLAEEGALDLVHQDLIRLFRPMPMAQVGEGELAAMARLLPADPPGGRRRPVLATHEGLIVVDPRRVAQAVARVWPDAQVLVTTRAPLGYLQSSFNNASHGGRTDPPEAFAAKFTRGHMRRSHDLDGVAAAYAETFGADRVHFLPHELLKADPAAWLARISDLTGADFGRHGSLARINASPPLAFLAMQRRLSAAVAARDPALVDSLLWRRFMHAANTAAGIAPDFGRWLDRRMAGTGEAAELELDLPVLPEGALAALAARMTLLRDLPLYRDHLALYGLEPSEPAPAPAPSVPSERPPA